MNKSFPKRSTVWMNAESCSIEDFRSVVEITTEHSDYPLSSEIVRNIPVYDASRIRDSLGNEQQLFDYMAEWNHLFLDGPGVVVFRGGYADLDLIDKVSGVLNEIIAEERRRLGNRGDHFAKAGENARVWNAIEKLCVADPALYARYAANDVLSLVSRSWLGPLYQVTAQVNLVYPGGRAQSPHRDYHMGFQTPDQLRHYPASAHQLSAALTLQGAIAHCDMPIESGPTKLLPYSQRYLPGYFATHLQPFRDYFEEHHVQLPLKKGDMLFFNPALFHAAGTNTSKDIERLANLLQIGSGYGRSIEIVDRARMSIAAYPAIRELSRSGALTPGEIENVIACTGEGYPFPANLDTDSPLSGMAPPSQQDILRQALDEDWEQDRLAAAIDAYVARRVSH